MTATGTASTADLYETHRMVRAAQWTMGDREGLVEYEALPRESPGGGGHLYLLEFDGDLSKVGRGVNPRGRVREHAFNAWVWDRRLVRGWVSDWIGDPLEAERRLIQWAQGHGVQRGGSEWFTNLPFHDAVQIGTELRLTKAQLERAAARRERAEEMEELRRSLRRQGLPSGTSPLSPSAKEQTA